MVAQKWIKIAVLALVVGISVVSSWPDDKLHVVVCDVGQGDGILIRKGTTEMVVDGGPDGKILDCLAKYMPFWDRTVEVVVGTHPQADHINGLIKLGQRYKVEQYILGPEGNETVGFRQLKQQIENSGAKINNVYSGDEIKFGKVSFRIVWPARRFVAEHVSGETRVLGMATDKTDLNSFAIVGMLSYGTFDMLLTADADREVEPSELETGLLRQVEVLKVPHHGSKTGMSQEWLDVVKPTLAIISVGKKNGYGHPTQEALNLLTGVGAKMMRTDQDGSVEVVSDGEKWWVKK